MSLHLFLKDYIWHSCLHLLTCLHVIKFFSVICLVSSNCSPNCIVLVVQEFAFIKRNTNIWLSSNPYSCSGSLCNCGLYKGLRKSGCGDQKQGPYWDSMPLAAAYSWKWAVFFKHNIKRGETYFRCGIPK